MIDIRPIRADEIESAKSLLPTDAAEPDWTHCYVVLEDNKIAGIMGTEVRLVGLFVQLVAEPLYMARTCGAVLAAIGFLDGVMRGIAAANGFGGYGFTIYDNNERFQRFIERHFVAKLVNQSGGARRYWRSFS